MFFNKAKYIKLVKGTNNYEYKVESYTADGELLGATDCKFADLDKLCPTKSKLRMKGNVWAIVTKLNTLLPIPLPKFLREA